MPLGQCMGRGGLQPHPGPGSQPSILAGGGRALSSEELVDARAGVQGQGRVSGGNVVLASVPTGAWV